MRFDPLASNNYNTKNRRGCPTKKYAGLVKNLHIKYIVTLTLIYIITLSNEISHTVLRIIPKEICFGIESNVRPFYMLYTTHCIAQ